MPARSDLPAILAIDQGTTGTTVLFFDHEEKIIGRGYQEIPQSFPAPGLVEHDPEAIWRSVLAGIRQAVDRAGATPAAMGITNQRETVILWDRKSGQPVAPALVWQDRRTAAACEGLRAAGHEPLVNRKTGLVLDPYFSATKIAWLLEHVPGLRARAERGEIAFGTVESFLIHRLSGGRVHVSDVSNAARTLLFDIESGAWDEDLCALFGVPAAVLPAVSACAGRFADTQGVPGLADGTPITGCAGDQQAALYGQGCLVPGDAKCTFGTGAFLLMNVGDRRVASQHGLLATVAWTLAGKTAYALEGSAFVSGALVQWLRDGLGIIQSAGDVQALAASVPDTAGVIIVPALAGLGAPHWRPDARGLISGLTRGTTRAHIARAALEAMAFQTVDLVVAMEKDAGRALTALRVDGGAAANDLLLQIQSDLLGVDVVRPPMIEVTALGAARLARLGLSAGTPAPTTPEDSAGAASHVFHPRMTETTRKEALARWHAAVARA